MHRNGPLPQVSSLSGWACANGLLEGPPMFALVDISFFGLMVNISVSSHLRVLSCLSRALNRCSTGSDSLGAVL